MVDDAPIVLQVGVVVTDHCISVVCSVEADVVLETFAVERITDKVLLADDDEFPRRYFVPLFQQVPYRLVEALLAELNVAHLVGDERIEVVLLKAAKGFEGSYWDGCGTTPTDQIRRGTDPGNPDHYGQER